MLAPSAVTNRERVNFQSVTLMAKKPRLTTDEKPPRPSPIRWMIRRDMAEVLEIERQSFEFPWLEEDFIQCLRQRNCIAMVYEQGEKILGFMIYELHKTRLHIPNFAVAPEFRHQGVGRAMVDKLVSKLSEQRRVAIVCEIRERNLAAQHFFAACGFKAVNVLRNYYEDSDEDAYLFRFRLPQNEACHA